MGNCSLRGAGYCRFGNFPCRKKEKRRIKTACGNLLPAGRSEAAVSSASYSTVNGEAVGRVRAVADMIQAETGGELFSIQTSVVYPADGGALIDYAAEVKWTSKDGTAKLL